MNQSNATCIIQGMVDLVLTGPYKGISAAYGCFTIKIETPNADPMKLEWDCDDPTYAAEVDAVEPAHHDINAPDGRKVAEVTYAVMSNALEATVEQVMLRLKDGHNPHGIVHGQIKAVVDGFQAGSILFNLNEGKCFSSSAGDTWLHLELARNVVAVPCGKMLDIEVDLKIKTSNDQEPKPFKATLRFDNRIMSQSGHHDGNEVKVNLTWYPEVSCCVDHSKHLIHYHLTSSFNE